MASSTSATWREKTREVGKVCKPLFYRLRDGVGGGRRRQW